MNLIKTYETVTCASLFCGLAQPVGYRWRVAEKMTLQERYQASFIGEILGVYPIAAEDHLLQIRCKVFKDRYDNKKEKYENVIFAELLQNSGSLDFAHFINKFLIRTTNETIIETLMRRMGYYQ